jgi:hypothetical protein
VAPASRTSLEVARRLLALEAAPRATPAGGQVRAIHAENLSRVCEKLRVTLTAFAGATGFRSLLTRALSLARAQEPSLEEVRVLEDGSLTGLELVRGATKTTDNRHSGEGTAGQVLIAHTLDLLIVFIGEPLTLQLLRSAWPDIPADSLRSRTKDTP